MTNQNRRDKNSSMNYSLIDFVSTHDYAGDTRKSLGINSSTPINVTPEFRRNIQVSESRPG